MKKIIYLFIFLTGFLMACEIEEVVDPNNPSLASVLNNASKAELQVLVTGLEARHRGYVTNATQMFGTFGREVLPYFASDPRFQNDWLGIGGSETYPDFFASAGTYVNPYLAVKQANVLVSSVDNTTLVTAQEAAGYKGFARTIKAYQLILPLMQQYENGIRIDVEDPLNPGPIVSYQEALTAIRQELDEAYAELQAAGSSFSFDLTAGFEGFDTPAGMAQVNRAIAARVALYDKDYVGALTALDDSFMTLDGDNMDLGPKHIYGEAPDVNNPLYYPLDKPTATILIVHPALLEDALPGDERVENKFYKRTNVASHANIKDANGPIPGEYQDFRWESNTDPIPFIRNEELILIYAEANALKASPDLTEAENAINIIRDTWGLDDYDGNLTAADLLEEIIFQRRYSLWAEGGHRWIDLRRTDKLNSSYIDLRDGGNIFTQLERRSSETNWDQNN